MGASLLLGLRRWFTARRPDPALPRWERIGDGIAVRDMTAEERRGWLGAERVRLERRRWLHRRGQHVNPSTWRTR